MAGLKDIRRRIASVKSSQKITKAMKMVSASKLKRATEAVVRDRIYLDAVNELMAEVITRTPEVATSRFYTEPDVGAEEKIKLIVISSDRGLCGGFNASIVRTVGRFIEFKRVSGVNLANISVLSIGSKSKEGLKKSRIQIEDSAKKVLSIKEFDMVSLARKEFEEFKDGSYDSVYVIYSHFISAMNQRVETKRLLPYKLETRPSALEFTYELNVEEFIEKSAFGGFAANLYHCLLESVASEHGARMTAMESATNNAVDMINRFTIMYNRARQAAITTELMEIVSGAEALK